MKTELINEDQQSRSRALSATESFIVQAPAGSGKTELIIQRYLKLLGLVKKPEEILAITFTKKAAHEMRLRVTKALDFALHQPEPTKEHEKLTWQLAKKVLQRNQEHQWQLIENPNQLHIKTIDSFCSYLTGQLPLLSHFGSTPDIALYAKPLYREAVLEVLSHVEENHPWSGAVARLLAHMDNDLNRLTQLLINMLEKRDQWQKYLNFEMSALDMRELLSQHIAAVADAALQQIESYFPDENREELKQLIIFATNNLAHTDSPLLSLTETMSGLTAWRAIADFLLTKQNTWRKTVNEEIGFPTLKDLKGDELRINKSMRARHKALVEVLSASEKLHDALENIRKLPDACYTDTQWAALQALLEVLKITLAQCRVTFQTHGQIDFIENAWGATLALGDEQTPTDLALSLDYQIRHILVDEFQDTSFSQYRLLTMLTHGWQAADGRTLFVVGDPMQSIYRFRQAEVGLFLRMQEHGIGTIPLQPLRLSVNFRSTQNIVEWNNQHFKAIFPAHSDIGTGAVHYSESIAHATESSPPSHIEVKGILEGDSPATALHVIRTIKQTLVQHPDESIAILVRSRSHLSAIIPALKAAGLPFQAVDIDPLISRQAVQDVLALTRALLHPADRIAWLAILRAPWCGLSLHDLLQLAGSDKQAILWQRLSQPEVIETLSADGITRLKRVIPILQAAINGRERDELRQWIERTWQALGGPATLNDYTEIDDIKSYFNLLDGISNDSSQVNIELLQERMELLYASMHHGHTPIQIMTVHSAKGLEFDTVIIPHLEKYNPPDDRSLLLWMEQPLANDQTALLLAPIHAADCEPDLLYRYIETTQRVKSHYEVDRLLYVATTRAKKRLHLVFNKDNYDTHSQRGSFLDKLWPLWQNQGNVALEAVHSDLPDSNHEAPEKKLRRLINNWHNPVNFPKQQQPASQQRHQGFQLQDQSARLIGTVAHTIFQQLANNGIQPWLELNPTSQCNYIKRHLLQAGLVPSQHEHAIQTILQNVTRAIKDERGSWILSPHKEAKSEFTLTLFNEGKFEQLIIDRTFVDEEGIRWIIDYKTATNADEALPVFIAKQKDKYKEQMQKYSRALAAIDDRPVKLGLYFPAIPAWCEYSC